MQGRHMVCFYKSLAVGALLFLLLILMFNTSGYAESARGVTDTTIKIGVILDQTGPTAGDITVPITQALRNRNMYINDNGGIFGRKLKLIVEDDRYSIPAGIAAFKKLLFKDKVFALIGPANTGEAKALLRHIEKLKVPNITGALDVSMVSPLRRYIFLSFCLYYDQFGVIYDYILNDLKPKECKITFMYPDVEFGKMGVESTKRWAKYFNFTFDTEIINFGALDATSQVLNIKRKRPTHIVIHHSSPAAIALLRDLKKFGVNTPVYGTLPTCTEDTVKMAGTASKNYIGIHGFSSWYDDLEGVKKMRKITLKYKPGTEKPHRNKMYTAGWVMSSVLTEGIKKAGKDLNIENMVSGLESIKALDTKGLCGPITFSPTDHYGLRHSKLFTGDPERGELVPITDWRLSPTKK